MTELQERMEKLHKAFLLRKLLKEQDVDVPDLQEILESIK